MTVGLPSFRGILSEVGALAPTLGAGDTSLEVGDFQDSSSFQNPTGLGCSSVAAMLRFCALMVLWKRFD